jgi:hypothetical protein
MRTPDRTPTDDDTLRLRRRNPNRGEVLALILLSVGTILVALALAAGVVLAILASAR